MTVESTPLIVEKIVQETDKAKSIFVTHKDGSPIDYKPGQFLHLGFEQMNGIAYRSYSLSTIPDEGAAFTVKEMENGDISRRLQHIKVGDQLALINVGGKFVLPQALQDIKQIFLFAAGSGITPIFSLLKQILYHHPSIQVYLAYSNSSPQSSIFYEQLKQLETQFQDRLQINFIFSSGKNLLKARLSGFWLQEIVEEHRKVDWQQVLAYACGPVEYMDNIKITLFTCGIRSEHFFMEYFETVSDEQMVPPPDKAAHTVHINLNGIDHSLLVQYPDTILTAGVNAGLKMPYSCRSGQCGSCTAKILYGEVWLQYNEVLTPDELQEGLTLTCMGCPVNGDVSLHYD